MTIGKLREKYEIAGVATQIKTSAPDTALAFAFDKGYLLPFKIMVYSLLRSGVMLDSPVVILTDDPEILEDEIVKCIVDDTWLIEGRIRDQLYGLARDNVGRPERAQWNKGTCLKWGVFRECVYHSVLFLDVDMLCLGDLSALLARHPGADLVGAPQFQRTMIGGPNGRLAAIEIEKRLRGLISESLPAFMGRLNSGVMHIRKKLLSEQFRESLFEFASKRVEINEQSHLTSFFRDEQNSKKYRMKLVSSQFNFHESYLGLIDHLDALELAKDIRILHYPGSPKPWQATIDHQSRITMMLWHQYSASASASRVVAA